MGKKLFAGTDSGGAKVCINSLLLKSADIQYVDRYLHNSVFFYGVLCSAISLVQRYGIKMAHCEIARDRVR
jgi:hypothetical protein